MQCLSGPPRVARKAVAVALLALCGCAREPSLRSYVYAELGSRAVAVFPLVHPPSSGNYFAYVPGNLTRPTAIAPADPARLLAAQWQTGRYCAISAQAFSFSNAEPDGQGPDVSYTYEFNPIIPLFGFAKLETNRAITDLKLSENDLKYVDRISIAIRNVRAFTIKSGLLRAPAAIPIDPGCARFRKIFPFQITRMYEADIDVNVEKLQGASVNLGLLRAKIMKQFQMSERGKGVVIAVEPRTIAN